MHRAWLLGSTAERMKSEAGGAKDLQRPLLEKRHEAPAPLLRRLLFGLVPCSAFMFSMLVACIALNVQWSSNGSLDLARVTGRTAVGSNLIPSWCLLLFRLICAPTAIAVVAIAICFGEGGVRLLSMFTIWTWIGMSLYWVQVSVMSWLYVLTGWTPGPAYAAVLWIWFEVLYAMAWLVFLAVWLVLLPFAHLAGAKDAVRLMLHPYVLFQHNANILLMQAELLFSLWTVNQRHCIFCLYFGMIYVLFNWGVHAKTKHWIYFFLDYNNAGVPSLIVLMVCLYSFFLLGTFLASLVGKE